MASDPALNRNIEQLGLDDSASNPEHSDHVVDDGAMEAVGLSSDAGHDLRLDQATFFRSVEEGNLHSLEAILKNRKPDVNAYNDDGMSALHVAVYKYEQGRNLEITKTLLAYGADVWIKAATTPSTHRISIIRHESKHLAAHTVLETRKVDFDQKPPLLVALELKSSLYLKGWEYRHWDPMLKVLAEATVKHFLDKEVKEFLPMPNAIPEIVQQNWEMLFQSGRHDLIEVWAEGKYISALRLLLSGASKVLRLNIESALASNSSRIDVKDASFTIVKTMVQFLYTGAVDPHFMSSRGIDLFHIAHKYGVESLKKICEAATVATQENWIKLLSAATECDSEVLALKCARSIFETMEHRLDESRIPRPSFSRNEEAPEQLFHAQQPS